MKGRGFALPWYAVLIQLREAPEGKLRMQELGDRVVVSCSGLTRLIDRQDGEGFVARAPSRTTAEEATPSSPRRGGPYSRGCRPATLPPFTRASAATWMRPICRRSTAP